MAAISMTGFGRGCAESDGVRVEVELASVNRKQFDFSFSAPASFSKFEAKSRDLVNARVTRGRVQCQTSVSFADVTGTGYDIEAIRLKADEMQKLADLTGLPNDLTLSKMLTMPGVVLSPDQRLGEAVLWTVLEKALVEALTSLCAMRKTEGEALAKDLSSRIASLQTRRGRVAALAPRVPQRYQEQLIKRIADLGVVLPVDDASLAREIALCAERWDVAEELTRLEAHVGHFMALLESSEPCGRQLDFLCQEMNREVNTIGSKANDAEIASTVIEMKSIVEAIREQVQNLE